MQIAPDNSKLIHLLEDFNSSRTNEKYNIIYHELSHGEVYLLLPSIHDNIKPGKWSTLAEGSKLKLLSVYQQEGMTILGAFTSENAMLLWSQKEVQYTAMLARDVLQLCQDHNFDRLVIDSHQPTMFVLQRNRSAIKSEVVEGDVYIEPPSGKLNDSILNKMDSFFTNVPVIEEVYQYRMIRKSAISLIIGFKLNADTEQAKEAAIRALQNAFQGEQSDLPVDATFLIENEEYEQIKSFPHSLLFTRS